MARCKFNWTRPKIVAELALLIRAVILFLSSEHGGAQASRVPMDCKGWRRLHEPLVHCVWCWQSSQPAVCKRNVSCLSCVGCCRVQLPSPYHHHHTPWGRLAPCISHRRCRSATRAILCPSLYTSSTDISCSLPDAGHPRLSLVPLSLLQTWPATGSRGIFSSDTSVWIARTRKITLLRWCVHAWFRLTTGPSCINDSILSGK